MVLNPPGVFVLEFNSLVQLILNLGPLVLGAQREPSATSVLSWRW